MNGIERSRARADRINKGCDLVVGLGIVDQVDFVGDDPTIYMKVDIDMIDMLHDLRKKMGNYQQTGYYMSGRNLAVRYMIEDTQFIFFHSKGVEDMLEWLSGGNCKIVSKTRVEEEKYIKCKV